MRPTTWPWLLLALAALAALISSPTGDEVGQRVMMLLIAAALITAIQQRPGRRSHSSEDTPE